MIMRKVFFVLAFFVVLAAAPNAALAAATQVHTEADLKRVGTEAVGDWSLAASYELKADITLTSEWMPIGTNATNFTGVFDGNGHKIYGLRVTNASAGGSETLGLFNIVGAGGVVKNLGVVEGRIAGDRHMGGVAGVNWGGTVENCWFTGSVESTASAIIGGVVGGNTGGTVKNCWFAGSVKGTDTGTIGAIGGVVGANIDTGIVENCWNAGSVESAGILAAGGVVGGNLGTVRNCVSLGLTVTGDFFVGRVVGSNESLTETGVLENNKARADMRVNGNIPNANIGANQINGASAALGTPLSSVFAGWDPAVWTIPAGNLIIGGPLPTLIGAPRSPAPTLPGVVNKDSGSSGCNAGIGVLGALALAFALRKRRG